MAAELTVLCRVLRWAAGRGGNRLAERRRLGLSDARRLAIAGIGAAGLLVTLLLMVAIDPATDGSIRLVVIVVGVVCYLATRELQKPADRVYAAGRDQAAYASLWLRGIATALVCGIATGVAVAAAAAA